MGFIWARSSGPIGEAIGGMAGPLRSVALFSGVVNILGLSGAFYMLQVYDRVLASRSYTTLLALSVLVVALYTLQAAVDLVRAQVLTRIGTRIEHELIAPVHDVVLRLPLVGRSHGEALQPVRDMETLRQFMGSLAPTALFDLPWAPLYLLFIFWLHPVLGAMTLAGMVVLLFLTLRAERALQHPTLEAVKAMGRRQAVVDAHCRNVEVIRAMGFSGAAARRFSAATDVMLDANRTAADTASFYQNFSKTFRYVFQSLMLGVGAYLVIRGQMSAGAIMASSILSGRALAPIDLVIGSWKQVVAARQAHHRLTEIFRGLPPAQERTDLPLASKTLAVEQLAVAPPGGRVPLVRNITFTLQAGDGLAVLGPSGAGKSTLIRALVGAWPVMAGHVRLDGAPLSQWPEEAISRLIGYLPQDVELFAGTIAENIARLDAEAPDEAVVAAARAANVHEMILRLPEGYQTRLGDGGHNLSVGQRQRIGLARALYGDPFLVVLDEPNAHLDQEGEAALAEALKGIRLRGGIVVLVAHRRGILQAINRVAFLAEGEIRAFGPRDETLRKIEAALAGRQPPTAPNAAPQRPAVRVATPLASGPRKGGDKPAEPKPSPAQPADQKPAADTPARTPPDADPHGETP